MSATFADAALERVAQCLGIKRQVGESAATALIARYMSEDHHMSWDAVSEHSVAASLWGGGSGLRFYTFGCLVEVGCAAGYIDVIGNSLRGPLEVAIKRFIDEENLRDDELALLRNLLKRLTSIGGFPKPDSSDAFHGFAAYLALNEAVWDDADFHQLLDSSDEKWTEDKDAHFLITPKHFAEAVITSQVDGIDASAAAAGIRTLEYFQSLRECIERLKNVEGLVDKALRAARWSHTAYDLLNRLVAWSSRMRGWAGIERDDTSGLIFTPMLEVFGVLAELGIAQPARIAATTETLSAPQMMQLGRLGEAQRIIEKELDAFLLPVEEKRLVEYVRLCLDLSEAGASESAAIRLARVESQLFTGDDYWANDAKELLRQLRIQGKSSVASERAGASVEATLMPLESIAMQPQYVGASGGTGSGS